MSARWTAVWMGLWCAGLQAGIYLAVETTITAAAWVYFALTGAWLAGLWLGLADRATDERLFIAAAMVLFSIGTPAALPLAGLLGGAASGRFVVKRQAWFRSAGQLLAWETVGFLLGWAAAMLGWLWHGQGWLLADALFTAGGVALGYLGRRRVTRTGEG